VAIKLANSRRQPLPATGPLRQLLQQLLDSIADTLPDRPAPRLRLRANRNGFGEVFPDGPTGNPELSRDLPRRPAFHQDFVTNDMDLIPR